MKDNYDIAFAKLQAEVLKKHNDLIHTNDAIPEYNCLKTLSEKLQRYRTMYVWVSKNWTQHPVFSLSMV